MPQINSWRLARLFGLHLVHKCKEVAVEGNRSATGAFTFSP